MSDSQKKFKEEILPKLQNELGAKSPMTVPRLSKIVLNVGLKEALKDDKAIQETVLRLTNISGQKPVVTRAKRAIAGFKLRQGDPIGVMVTVRGTRMYDFFERLVGIVLPRVRDFHGVSKDGFDGHGNYSLGFSEMSVFPELDGSLGKSRGIEITIVTTAKKDDEGKRLLEVLGMPFRKNNLTN